MDEFFSKVVGRYRVYVVYPQVPSIEELQARLAQRVHIMAKEKGFARFVEPEAAAMFVKTHQDYMQAFLLPKLGSIINALYLVYPSDASYQKITIDGVEKGKLETPLRSCEVPATGASTSGGKRKHYSRKQRKRRKTRRRH